MTKLLQVLGLACGTGGEPCGPPVLEGSLDVLRELVIFTQNHHAEGFNAWIPHMRSLVTLIMSVWDKTGRVPFRGWQVPDGVAALRLRNLFLHRLQFPKEPETIAGMLNLRVLEHLILRGCRNSAPLLHLMAQSFKSDPEAPKLRISESSSESAGTFVSGSVCPGWSRAYVVERDHH